MKKLIIILAAAAMAGCGIYKPYTRPEEIKRTATRPSVQVSSAV